MVRPRRRRRVRGGPRVHSFTPKKASDKERVILNVEELESIRLSDYLGLEQKEAAQKMGISQPTFSRNLEKARKKIAQALVKGQPIKIEGGNYQILKHFSCFECGNSWEGPREIPCPNCGSEKVKLTSKGKNE